MKPLKYLFLLIIGFWANILHAQDLDSMRLKTSTLEGREKVDLLNEIGYYFPEESLKEVKLALQISQEIDYLYGIAESYDMMGEHYVFVENFEQSRKYRTKAIDLYLKLGLDKLAFQSLVPSIYLDIEERKYFDALRKGLKLKQLAEDINDSLLLADAYTVMSRIYDEGILNMDQSMKFLHEAKIIYEKHNRVRELVGLYNDIGTGYGELEKLDSAAFFYAKGLQLARELFNNDPRFDDADLALLLTNSAQTKTEQGYLEEGLRLSLEALEKYNEAPYNYYYPTIVSNISLAYFHLGDLKNAKRYLNEALSSATELNSTLDLVEIYHLFKKINQQENNLLKALEFQELYQVTRDSIYNGERAANLEWIRAQYDLKKIEKENDLLNTRFRFIIVIVVLLIIGIILGYIFLRKLHSKNITIQFQNNELEKLNTTKDRLFAIIAHDFKAPLINFQNMAGKIAYLLKKKQPERVQAMGHIIEENVSRLKRQMDNLLNWAMTQTGQLPYNPEKLCLNNFGEGRLDTFIMLAEEKQIQINWNIENELCSFIDRQALELIVRNLLSNALKFTPEKGTINFAAIKENEWIVIIIEDSGVGMSTEKLSDIFDIYNRKSSVGTNGEKGTGLGLVVCKELIELNKGKIAIESELGKGTKVQLYLPKF